MLRANYGLYDPFEDRFDDWFKRWFVDPAFPGFPSSRLSRADSNRVKYYAYSVPGFGDFLKTVSRSGELSDYMDRYGLTWDSIDPLHANDRFGANPISAGSSAVRLSKNLMRLYR